MDFKNVKLKLSSDPVESRIEVDGEILKSVQKVEVIQDINSNLTIPQLKLTVTPENIEIEGEAQIIKKEKGKRTDE